MKFTHVQVAASFAIAATGLTTFMSAPPAQALQMRASQAALELPSSVPLSTAVVLPTGKVNLKMVTTNNLNMRKGTGTHTGVLLTIPPKHHADNC